jgi:hypothetical protein
VSERESARERESERERARERESERESARARERERGAHMPTGRVCVCALTPQRGQLLNCQNKREKEKRQKRTSATIPEGPTAQSPD